MRLGVAVAIACLSIIGLSQADDVRASIRKPTNIPAEDLASALQALAKDRNFQVVYVSEEVNHLRTQGAVGEFTSDEALKQLLKGTGLAYRYLDEKTVTIVVVKAPGISSSTTASANPSTPGSASPAEDQSQKGGSFWDRFLVAQATSGQAASSSAVEKKSEQASNKEPVRLEEVVVTAQKRSERLQDVPVPVTALGADALATQDQTRLQDYFSTVPGLNASPMGLHSVETLSIRGITTGAFGSEPVVGITLDDVPLGSSTSVGGGVVAPDIDPSDLSGIEVLRGPQGTLYGASSLGGLIKYVTTYPSTDGFGGHVQVGTLSIKNGDGLGYNARGSINVPVGDTFAIRLGGFTRQDAGYIDNPVYGPKGGNEIRTDGGLLSSMWRPSDVFSLKLTALYQDQKADGSSDIDVPTNGYTGPSLGDLQQNYIPGIGGSEKKIEFYSGTAKIKLGTVDLTSVTGYSETSYFDTFDFSYLLGALNGLFGFPGVGGDPIYEHGITHKFSQELRLDIPLGQVADWLVGGYFTHEASKYYESIWARDILTQQNVGNLYLAPSVPTGPGIVEEYAAFTNITFHITSQLDVQIGGRQSHIEESNPASATSGLLNTSMTQGSTASFTPFTYLFTPQFKFSEDLMAYARLASGYRAGGGGAQGATATCVVHDFSCSFGPDKTYDYEVGVKGSALDQRIRFDASLYYINWKDVQVTAVADGLYGYNSNGGSARSQGVELSLDARPLDRLTITMRLAYTDAELTENFPGYPNPTNGEAYGANGDRLPDTSRFTGYAAAERTFPLAGSVTALIGADERYVSSHLGQFLTAAGPRQYFPPYAQTDLHAGLNYDGWSALLYANNLTDRRGVLAGGLGTYPPFAFTYIQPRTVGLTLSKTF